MKIQKYIREILFFYGGFILIVLFQSCQFEVKEFTKPFDSDELKEMTQEDKQWLLYRTIKVLDCEFHHHHDNNIFLNFPIHKNY